MTRGGPVLFFEGLFGIAWRPLALQRLGDPPASISNNHERGRDVYVTQVYPTYATISRMPGGIDIEEGVYRILDPRELERAEVLHTLHSGDAVQLFLKPGRASQARHVRYRFEIQV